MIVHAYEIGDRPGVRLYIGTRGGRVRPELWIESITDHDGEPATLASFHGDKHMQATVNFLDTLCGAVQRAVNHHGRHPE